MNKYIKFFLTLVLTNLASNSAIADSRWLEFDLDLQQKPTEASGIVFSNKNANITSQIAINETPEGQTVIAIPYELKEQASQQYAFTIAKTAENKTIYSTVKQLGNNSPDNSIYALSKCSPEDVDPVMQSQLSLISNLLELRIKRRANFDTKTKQLLSGEFLEKMKRYEVGFGLQGEKELSADLTPFELVDRLDRILHTLRKISSK